NDERTTVWRYEIMGTTTLSKVLHIREREKIDAQKAYNQSMESFEEVATRLYQLLKKKEDAEVAYEISIQEPTPIEIIRQQMDYIEMLSRKIIKLEQDLQKARTEMENKHGKLKDAYVEVKKFEKIIQVRKNSVEEMERKRERETMDEISINQYLAKQKQVK